METNSPYQTPKAELLYEQEEEYGPIKILSVKGRIGRLRYFTYTISITVLLYIIIMLGLALIVVGNVTKETLSVIQLLIMILGFGAMFFINILLTIQRCHDFNMTGWLSLLIPLVLLIFWFFPGTQGANRYGPPPPPNKGVAPILIMVFILMLVLSVLATVGIQFIRNV
jgi:uncharacterized membrane protein YhaH (DUF805 family)